MSTPANIPTTWLSEHYYKRYKNFVEDHEQTETRKMKERICVAYKYIESCMYIRI